ncbi:hypothetical protein F4860DRAFT_460186 [Xylaria cubensis]|nr:hypothetical protein F4860DRAFT_460186 [Xylaria cubensis]
MVKDHSVSTERFLVICVSCITSTLLACALDLGQRRESQLCVNVVVVVLFWHIDGSLWS